MLRSCLRFLTLITMGKSDCRRTSNFKFLLKLFLVIRFFFLLFYLIFDIFRFLFLNFLIVLRLQILANLLIFLELYHEINQVLVSVQKENWLKKLRIFLVLNFALVILVKRLVSTFPGIQNRIGQLLRSLFSNFL